MNTLPPAANTSASQSAAPTSANVLTTTIVVDIVLTFFVAATGCALNGMLDGADVAAYHLAKEILCEHNHAVVHRAWLTSVSAPRNRLQI